MPDHIYDLKTIDDINRIERHIYTMKYWFTSGWYRNVIERATGHSHDHTFIFAEKKPPFRWRIVNLDKEDMNYGYDVANSMMSEMDSCFGLDDFTDFTNVRMNLNLNLNARRVA